MTEKILVVAPHPDDESLGVAGTLLKHQAQGDELHWLIMTHTEGNDLFPADFAKARQQQIEKVASLYPMKQYQLPFLAAQLETYPLGNIITEVSRVIQAIKPSMVYIPFSEDVHSDHRITYQALMACTKPFRYPFIKQVLAYETLSETDHSPIDRSPFRANVFVDISDFFSKKMAILKHYESEMGESPFPRSFDAVESLAKVRGAQAWMHYAEAFMLLKQCR